jgi:hypothetical protein
MPYIARHPEVKNLWTAIQNIIGKRALLRVYINAYTFGTDGYAHTDDIWISKKFGADALSETIIVYLNEQWDIDWAGETVVFDQTLEIEKAVLPKLGRVFVFDSNKLHAARPVSRACTDLRSVLVFKTIDTKINSTQVDYILEKTKNCQHGNKSFFEHLYDTMLTLENHRQSPHVILAGLYHAVYGTEYYEFHALDRSEVRTQIGVAAEQLVWEFCQIKDRFNSLINNKNNYSEAIRKDLLMIEMANLLDQNQNGRHQANIDQIKTMYSINL